VIDKNKIQRDYYNNIANEYDVHYGNKYALKYRKKLYKKIIDKHFPGKGERRGKALDAMCGGGQSTFALMDYGFDFVGVDISDQQCINYKNRFPHSNVLRSSILETNFNDGEFDLIVTDSLHHLHPNVNQCIDEFIRLLKPGGVILLWEPSSGSIFDYLRRAWYRLDKKFFEDNEASIDIDRIKRDHMNSIELKKCIYGGNIGYLLINTSLILRINIKLMPIIYILFYPIDKFIEIFQTKQTSIWGLALFVKKSS
jgi:ubiquinone/menaquinone biosynthesis C-methylase UbiE